MFVDRDEDEADFELDSWARWDQPSDFTEYYDVIENAEGNTGYDGSAVWEFIHSKICFQKDVDRAGNEWKARTFARATRTWEHRRNIQFMQRFPELLAVPHEMRAARLLCPRALFSNLRNHPL